MANILDQVLNAAITGINNLTSSIQQLAQSGTGENNDSTVFLRLQNLSAQYQMAVSVTSTVMKVLSDTVQGVIQKIG